MTEAKQKKRLDRDIPPVQPVLSEETTLVCFAIKLDLIGLHHFLNRLSNITQTHINAGILQQTDGKS